MFRTFTLPVLMCSSSEFYFVLYFWMQTDRADCNDDGMGEIFLNMNSESRGKRTQWEMLLFW